MSQLGPGGAAIASLGVGHAVQVEPRTGGLGVSVPIEVTPGRNGFGPRLALDHHAGSSNGAFGRGWSLTGLLGVSVHTAHGLPRYDGTDTYAVSGVGELVAFAQDGAELWEDRGAFRVRRHGPRSDQAFLRIECWQEKAGGRTHWRIRDARNTLTIFGERADDTSRIFDPAHPDRVFSWLPDLQVDAVGNAIRYTYVAETLHGVDRGRPEESLRTRTGLPPAQRYLKSVQWGNVKPVVAGAADPPGQRWPFQLVFDHGDHAAEAGPAPDQPAPVRPDAFSSYPTGFEIRQYRLCRRLLLFHDFPELAAGPVLVQSYVLDHELRPDGSLLQAVRRVGHRDDGGTRTARQRPPLVFEYTAPSVAAAFLPAPSSTLEDLPHGLDGPHCRLIDLYGEGMPGILLDYPDAWLYRANLGDGRFAPERLVLEKPSHSVAQVVVQDFDGDGNTDLVVQGSRTSGYYEFDREDQRWHGFRPFASTPHVDALSSQWLDLDGDGMADLVLAGPDRLVCYPSLGKAGFGEGWTVQPEAAGAGGDLTAPWRESGQLDYVFADMSGDGLLDQVLVRNGLVVYWPNLGQGRFGAPVFMDGAPRFAPDGAFDAGRLMFADIDGTGTSDLLYVGTGEITVWTNASGNALLPGRVIAGLPLIDRTSTLRVLDFLGDGTQCLVWSRTSSAGAASMQYLPLTSGAKPGLITRIDNSMGLERRVTYATSAAHYLRDAAAGRPWRRKLPRHVVVVDRLDTIDQIGAARSHVLYRYHDGSYDGRERQFRGFGFVEVFDAETMPADGTDLQHTAPSCSRLWFHLGAEQVSSRDRMWAGDPNAAALSYHAFDTPAALTADETDDALLALAGRRVRQEVFGLEPDGTLAATPFTVEESAFLIRRLQPALGTRRARFAVFDRETLSATYEGVAPDPRIAHHLALEVDAFGATVLVCDVAYPRRLAIPAADPAQRRTEITLNRVTLRHIDQPDRVELATQVESDEFDLSGLDAAPGAVFAWTDLRAQVAAALAAPVDFDAAAPAPGAARRVSWSRQLYWNGAGTDILPAGETATPLRLHHVEHAAFTPSLVAGVYGARVDPPKLVAAGYVLAAGHWWRVGETFAYAGADGFFLLNEVRRADGGVTAITYDASLLKAVETRDAAGNALTAVFDYHVLAPARTTDENGTVTEVRYDPLGVAIATTRWGDVPGAAGPLPYGFGRMADFTIPAGATPDTALADPGAHVQGIGTLTLYDLDRWASQGQPPVAVAIARENLLHDGTGAQLPPGEVSVALTYLDGFGRPLQTKLKVEPGDAVARGPDGALQLGADGRPLLAPAAERWLVQGHAVYDRKQQQIRRYEPYFSSQSRMEAEAELARFGVAQAFLYDALGRPVRHDAPDGTFSTTGYGAWGGRQSDANDNVEASTYRALRQGLAPTAPERRAYEGAKAHDGTPVVSHLDPLGRTVLVTEADGLGQERRTASRFGADGHLDQVVDPRGLVALAQVHDMLGRLVKSTAMDAGGTVVFFDGFDRPAEAWNDRGVHLRRSFDRLDRLVGVDADGLPGLNRRTQAIVYGDDPGVPDAAARNLRGAAVIVRDDAGVRSLDLCSPLGQVLASTQRIAADPRQPPDWTDPGSVALMAETFVTTAAFDGMGRAVRQSSPDGSVRHLSYNRMNGLRETRVSTDDGRVVDLAVFTGAAFNARGQRESVTLGNGVELRHAFDPDTWRTRTMSARRTTGPAPGPMMDIDYTYDPVGNIVISQDNAQEPGAAAAVIAGLAVPAEKSYAYDAFYRLRAASGRVHKALLPDDHRTDAVNIGSTEGTRRLSLNDGGQVGRYTEAFTYDLSGNLTTLVHAGPGAGWTNGFWVSPTSNRSLPSLDANGLPVAAPETQFDASGNCLRFPHLRTVAWSYADALEKAVIIDRSAAGQPDDAEYYLSDSAGRRVRKLAERLVGPGLVEATETIYLDGCEIRRISRNGALTLERRVTHVGDGVNRVAQIHRWTRDDAARETDDIAAVRTRYQVNDHLGSAHLALDEAGAVIAYEEYLPFGGTAFVAGDDVREVALRSYRFCGKERDDATGLYHFGHRSYAPWLCRWISPDPAGFVDGPNLYLYVHNNPVTYFDPDGLQTAQAQGREKQVYGARPLAVDEAFASLPKARQEQLKQLQARGDMSWFMEAGTGKVSFGTHAEMRALVDAKLKAGQNVGSLHQAPRGAKPGDPTGKGGAGAARKPPPRAPRAPPAGDGGDAAAAGPGDAGARTPGTGSGGGDPGQAQDGSGGAAKGAGDKPGDATGKDTAKDPGASSANPGDGGGDGSAPGTGKGVPGGTGGTGTGTGTKGTGPGGGGSGDEVGTGTGAKPGTGTGTGGGTGAGPGSGVGHGHGHGDDGADGGTGPGGGDHEGSGDGKGDQHGGVPGGHGHVPGGHGTSPGGTGTQPGGVDGGVRGGGPHGGPSGGRPNGTGADPNGQPNGNKDTGGHASNGQTATGDANGHRNDGGSGTGGGAVPDPNANGKGSPQGKPGGHGQPGGKPGGDGSGKGGPPQKKTVMDYVTQVAGYWNLEFSGDPKGASGGVPGGFGTHNWGAWGQAIYVALTVADIVLTFLSLGGLAGIKASLKAGWAAAKKMITTVGRKIALHFSEEATEKAIARFSIKTLFAGAKNGLKSSGSRFWNWFNFFKDQGGVTTPGLGKRFLGFWSSHPSSIVNQDLIASGGKWTAAAIDTAAHEGFHKLVGRFLGPVWDAGNFVFKGQRMGAGVMWAEETLAYGIGRGAAGRLHGVLLAPLEAFGSVFSNYGGGKAGLNAVLWAGGEVGLVGGGIAAYFGLRDPHKEPEHQGAAP